MVACPGNAPAPHPGLHTWSMPSNAVGARPVRRSLRTLHGRGHDHADLGVVYDLRHAQDGYGLRGSPIFTTWARPGLAWDSMHGNLVGTPSAPPVFPTTTHTSRPARVVVTPHFPIYTSRPARVVCSPHFPNLACSVLDFQDVLKSDKTSSVSLSGYWFPSSPRSSPHATVKDVLQLLLGKTVQTDE